MLGNNTNRQNGNNQRYKISSGIELNNSTSSLNSLDLENTIVEDIDLDEVVAPIAINIVQQRDISLDSSSSTTTPNQTQNHNQNQNHITIFIEKENSNNIKDLIGGIKNQLESIINDLNRFESQITELEPTNQYKQWIEFIDQVQSNSQSNLGVFLTIPNLSNLVQLQKEKEMENEQQIKDDDSNSSTSSTPPHNIATSNGTINTSSNSSNSISATGILSSIMKKNFEPISVSQMIKNTQISNSSNTIENSNSKSDGNIGSPNHPVIVKQHKSWTSTKPTGSSIFGSLPTTKALLNGSGGSRFFTSRQDLLANINGTGSSESSSSSTSLTSTPISSPSISSVVTPPSPLPLNSSPQSDSPVLVSSGATTSTPNKFSKHNSVIYNKFYYENCESKYDDPSEEDEIIISNDGHWETNVIVLLPCRHQVKIPGSSETTVESIRHLAWASGKMQEHLINKEVNDFSLRWGNNDILFDDETPLKDLVLYSPSSTKIRNIKFELVEIDMLCKERLVDLSSSLINGRPVYWKSHVEEVLSFNRKMKSIAALESGEHSTAKLVEMARLTTYPPPKTIPDSFVIRVHVQNQTKSLRCSTNHTAQSLMMILSEKVKNTLPFNPSEWRFLITGVYQLISPKVPLLSIEYIREKIKRTGEVDLTMIELSSLNVNNKYESFETNKQLHNNNNSNGNSNGNNSNSSSNSNNNNNQNNQNSLLDIIFKNDKQELYNNNGSLNSSQTNMLSQSQVKEINNLVSSINCNENLQIRILHAHEIFAYNILDSFGTSDPLNVQIYLEVGIYYGGEVLGSVVNSSFVAYQDTVVWNEWIHIPLLISAIPLGSRVCFGLNAKYRDSIINIGWVGHRLYDSKGIFNTSTPYSLLLWPGKVNPIGTCVDNLQSKDQAIIIAYEFKDYYSPKLIHLSRDLYYEIELDHDDLQVPTISDKEIERIDIIIRQDPLYQLAKEEKVLFWNSRYYCQTKPTSLPKLLQSVEWTNYKQVFEMYRLLKNWPMLASLDAIELLDPKFADSIEIREYVVKSLDQLTDYELELYLLQLVQAMKHDVFHGSALSLFLLGRVLSNPKVLAHSFFWHLRADIDNQEVSERFRVLLAYLLKYTPQLIPEFKKQINTLKVLDNLAKQVKDLPFDKRRPYLENQLYEDTQLCDSASSLVIPFDPSIRVNSILPEKCKPMDSAKVPLWTVFKNSDPFAGNFQMIVKTGDDLRQDILTLQLLKLMDHMWKSESLDLHMTIYRVIATGLGTGLIEVVNNSETAARIQAAAGGMAGAFKQTPIANWLKNHNLTENNYQKAVSKFTLSCAGYCVATYVLGIGDRHNDNIMIDKYGHLFHIDFGHFLGNFKTFAGFQREKAPFVLTPDFVYVIGGKDSPNFNFFVDICCKAYNILRKNANIFFNMFELMLSTGIPELKSESDILYLRDKFRLDLNDIEAADRFKKLIHESINTLTTQINFAFHIMAHRKAIVQDRKSLLQDSNNNNNNSSSIKDKDREKEKEKEVLITRDTSFYKDQTLN